MQTAVKTLIMDIKNNPESWRPELTVGSFPGISKDGVVISDYGNTRLFSIIKLHVNEKHFNLTWVDLWMLEKTLKWWFSTVSLEKLIKEVS